MLALRAEELCKKLDGIVQSNDGLRKFMDRCEHRLVEYDPYPNFTDKYFLAFALHG